MENAQKTAKPEAAAPKKRKRAEAPALRGVRQAPKEAVLKVREAVPALRKEKIKQTEAEPAKKARVKAKPAKKARVKADPAKAKQVKTKQVGAAQVKVKPVERAEVKRKTALRLVPGQMIAEQTGNPGTVLT